MRRPRWNARLRSADDPRIRVLYLIKTLVPGGAEQLLRTHLHFVDRAMFEIHVAYVLDVGGDLPADVRRNSDRVIQLGRAGRTGGIGAIGLARLLATERYDVVHIHSPVLGSLARVLLRIRYGGRRPVIITTEHLVWNGYHRITRAVNRATISRDDWIFAVSPEVRSSIAVSHPERIEVLIHGVDRTIFRPDDLRRHKERARLGIDDGTYVVGSIANFRPQKNHLFMIDIADEMARRGTPFAWLLAGSGPTQREVSESVERRGLGDKVRIVGITADSASLLNAMDVFVLTSLWEGLPVALMEALASGLPVVASDVDGIHDAVDATGAALLFDLESTGPGEVSDMLDELRNDAALRTSMGRSSLALSERFDATRVSAAICARYLELLDARRPRVS